MAVLGKELLDRWRAPKAVEIQADEKLIGLQFNRISELELRLDGIVESHRATLERVRAEYEARLAQYRFDLHACKNECFKLQIELMKKGEPPHLTSQT